MRLESYRDLKTGSIRVEGSGFTVLIETDGTVTASGKVKVAQPAAQSPDVPSPRSQSAYRKRGAR